MEEEAYVLINEKGEYIDKNIFVYKKKKQQWEYVPYQSLSAGVRLHSTLQKAVQTGKGIIELAAKYKVVLKPKIVHLNVISEEKINIIDLENVDIVS